MSKTKAAATGGKEALISALEANGYQRTTDPSNMTGLHFVEDVRTDGGTCVCFRCPCQCPYQDIKATCPEHGYCCFCYDKDGNLADSCCTSTKPKFESPKS